MSEQLLKPEAERLRIGIASGWTPVKRAVVWADEVIDVSREVPASVLDIALGSHLAPWEMARLLAQVPGSCDHAAVLRVALRDLLAWIGDSPERSEQATVWLEAAASSGELDDAAVGGDVYGLGDAFYFGREGFPGHSIMQAHSGVIAYLRRYTRSAT